MRPSAGARALPGREVTLSPGVIAIFKGLPKKRARKGEGERLPPTIGMVVKATPTELVIRLRIGGAGSQTYAPKARTCEPANVVRIATPRERQQGFVIDPLP